MADTTGAPGTGETPSHGAAGQETAPTGGERTPTGRKFTDDEAAQLLKENMANKHKLAALEAKQQKAEEDRLKKDGDHQKLAELAQAKAATAERAAIRAELKALAVREGLSDLDLVQLIDATGVKLGDDGSIVGAAEAIATFKAAKPHFFQAGPANVPGTARPGAAGSGGFKTWDDYIKAPEADRKSWATKHPDAFKALAAAAATTNRR